jgi:hypothetical protein
MWESPAVEQYDEGISEDNKRVDINGLEEARYVALVQSARYLEGIRCYHGRNISECSFNVSDIVLCRIQIMEGLQAQLAMGRSLLSLQGDRTWLLPPPDT